jgi:hypothetical protein
MNPSEGYQVVLILEIKNLLLIHGGARVWSSVLFWNKEMGDLELIFVLKTQFWLILVDNMLFIIYQTSSQNTTGFNIFVSVLLRQVHEFGQ